RSSLSFAATSGVQYRIAVDGTAGAQGDVVVRINVPTNDDIADPIDITDSGFAPLPISTVGATVEPFEPRYSTSGTPRSVWLRWTITTPGPRVLRAASFDLEIYAGTGYAD